MADGRGPTAFVFPGVGVPPAGGEAPFLERHREVMAPFLREASLAAGEDLEAAVLENRMAQLDPGSGELLAHAFDAAVAAVVTGLGIRPVFVAGHSLGLYPALVAAGALSFTDGLKVVAAARSIAREVAGSGDFALGAVVGLEEREITELIGAAPSSLALVNMVTRITSVVAGERADVLAALGEAEERGAVKAVLLAVDLPYHHPGFMAGAEEPLARFLATLSWRPALCPVLSPVDGRPLTEPAELLAATARNLTHPFRWLRVVERLAAEGVTAVIECGPGLSLSQSAHFIENAPRHLHLKTVERWLEK